MIAEAAYYLAQKRSFGGDGALEDWLAAEQQVRHLISPVPHPEATMNDTPETRVKSDANEQPDNAGRGANPRQAPGASRYEKFATTQAAGDGREGDALKPAKTLDEKLGANMPDRK